MSNKMIYLFPVFPPLTLQFFKFKTDINLHNKHAREWNQGSGVTLDPIAGAGLFALSPSNTG
jgi:hypothetical protein